MDLTIVTILIGLTLLVGLGYRHLLRRLAETRTELIQLRDQVKTNQTRQQQAEFQLESRLLNEIIHRQSLRIRVLALSKHVDDLADGIVSLREPIKVIETQLASLQRLQVPDPIDWNRVLDGSYPLETVQAIVRSFADPESERAQALTMAPDRYLLTALLPHLDDLCSTREVWSTTTHSNHTIEKWTELFSTVTPLAIMYWEMLRRAKAQNSIGANDKEGPHLIKHVYSGLLAEIRSTADQATVADV